MTTTTRTELTTADLEAGYDHEDYEGFGYLGERARCARISWMQVVDAVVLERANELGWSADRLAEWAISKPGRWFGDATFGSYSATAATFNPLQLRAIAQAQANLIR
jgi:hypothetical protein